MSEYRGRSRGEAVVVREGFGWDALASVAEIERRCGECLECLRLQSFTASGADWTALAEDMESVYEYLDSLDASVPMPSDTDLDAQFEALDRLLDGV